MIDRTPKYIEIMKKFVLFFIFLIFATAGFSQGRCKDAAANEKALANLKHHNLMQEYEIYLQKGTKDITPTAGLKINLTRGMKYRLYGISSSKYQGKIVLNLYSSPNKNTLLGSTFNYASKKHYEAIEFVAHTTGVFFLELEFEAGKEGCAVVIASYINVVNN